MFKTRNTLILGGMLAAAAVILASSLGVGATKAEGPQLAHMVYFKLKDNSAGEPAKLTAACKLFLSNHPGTVYFGTGTLAGDLESANSTTAISTSRCTWSSSARKPSTSTTNTHDT